MMPETWFLKLAGIKKGDYEIEGFSISQALTLF